MTKSTGNRKATASARNGSKSTRGTVAKAGAARAGTKAATTRGAVLKKSASSKGATKVSVKTATKAAPKSPATKSSTKTTVAKTAATKSAVKARTTTDAPRTASANGTATVGSRKAGATAVRPKSGAAKAASAVKTNGVKTNGARSGAGRKSSGSVSVAVRPTDGMVNYDGSPSVEKLRSVKTGLSKKDLEAYRRLLLDKWAELSGDVDRLTHDALGDGGDLSHMPMHMADVGTDNYSQSFNLGVMESERKLLNEIADALRRVDNGTYGVCLETAVPIGRPRLDAKPWAKYCIEVARDRERRGLGGG